jgi:SAM-dependent methyltransferase
MSTERVKKAIQAGWDEASESYQAETRISLEDVHYAPLAPGERELRLLGDVRGKRVLELACGGAQNSIALARWGARVTALDFSRRQLRKARELIVREGVAVNLLCADMERLGMLRDGVFDIVLSSFGWEFAPDLGKCFRECCRVMNKGGLLIVCTVHPLTAFEWDEDEKTLLVTDYFNLPVELWDEPSGEGQKGMTFFHTVEETFGLLTSSGFVVERILEPYPYPLHTMSEAEKRAIPYIGPAWEKLYERFKRVPFAIIYAARKP